MSTAADTAYVLRFERVYIRMGRGGSKNLGESQSRLYAHMRAKLRRGPTAVSKKVPFNFISRFVTHHVHRITHESLMMTYFQCGPLMTCGSLEWEVGSTTVTHSSVDWWELLLPLV